MAPCIMYGETVTETFQTKVIGSTHTGTVGTVTYTTPGINASKPYDLKSDLLSVDVIIHPKPDHSRRKAK